MTEKITAQEPIGSRTAKDRNRLILLKKSNIRSLAWWLRRHWRKFIYSSRILPKFGQFYPAVRMRF